MYRLTSRPRGRRRALDLNKKNLVCDAVARGATLAQAAATVGVSLRTVQREARLDHVFDETLRTSYAVKPDPLALMHSAARSHWRAAAWLLERTDPENYGRRTASACTPPQFDEAIKIVIEAALRLAPTDERGAAYAVLSAAADQAFTVLFPLYGPFGRRLAPQRPATPLADAEHLALLRNPPPHRIVRDPLVPTPSQLSEPRQLSEPAHPRPQQLRKPGRPRPRLPSPPLALPIFVTSVTQNARCDKYHNVPTHSATPSNAVECGIATNQAAHSIRPAPP